MMKPFKVRSVIVPSLLTALTVASIIISFPMAVTEAARAPDRIPPQLSITHSPLNPTTEDKVTFSAIASDQSGIKEIEIFVNGIMATSNKTSPCIYVSEPFQAGTVSYYAIAYDTVGNKAVTEPFSFAVRAPGILEDDTPPDVMVTHSPEKPTTVQTVTFTVAATDASGIMQISLFVNGRLVQSSKNSSLTYVSGPFPEGIVYYSAVAYDMARNIGASGESPIIVTSIGPVLPCPLLIMSYEPFYPTNRDLITFTAAGCSQRVKSITMSVGFHTNPWGYLTESVVAQCNASTCKYTGGPFSAGSIPFIVHVFDENNEQIYVGAQDVNVLHWDNTPPQIDVTYSPSRPTTQDVVVFTATASDTDGEGVHDYELVVNGRVLCTGNYYHPSCTCATKLKKGTNTYSATAWDMAGNEASTGDLFLNVEDVPLGYVRIDGYLEYEEADSPGGYIITRGFKPVREVSIELIAGSSNYHVATDSEGYFSFIINRPPGSFYLKLKAVNYAATVEKDYDWCNEYVWWESQAYAIQPNSSSMYLGRLQVGASTNLDFTAYWKETSAGFCGGDTHQFSGGSAYFNIAETILVERSYADGNRDDDDTIGRVSVAYPSGSWPLESPFYDEIYLPAYPAKENRDFGFVDATILHEYAHHLQEEISENDWGMGRTHSFCDEIDEELAWAEGFAEYMSALLTNGHRAGPYFLSQERTYYSACECNQSGCCSSLNSEVEGAVVAVLWDLVDEYGPEYPDSCNESYDNISGEDATIFYIFDTEMDNLVDAPDILEFIFCPDGWYERFRGNPRGDAITPILTQYNIPTIIGIGWGAC